MSMSSSDAPAGAPEAATGPAGGLAVIGTVEQLIAAREARGWSSADLAAKLGMMPRQVEAIERGDWSALPGQAFVRGAIRAYGKALQADVEPLLAAAGREVSAPVLRSAASLEAPLPRRGALGFDSGGSGSRLTWILLAILGVVAIALYFGRGGEWTRVLEGGAPAATPGRGAEPAQPPAAPAPAAPASSAPATPAASTPAALSPVHAVPVQLAPMNPAAGNAAPAGEAASGDAVPGGTVPGGAGAASTSAAAMPAGAAAEGPAGAAADTLRFRFEGQSWVDVRDAAGRVLLHGTQPAQSTREVGSKRPYALVVGNAAHVHLEHDGRTVDLAGVTRQGVARLTIR